MSQFENSEIMLNFANIMLKQAEDEPESSGMDWVDIAAGTGVGIGAELGISALISYVGIGTAAAIGLPVAVLAGIIGGVVYYSSMLTEDFDELVNRLEDLDAGEYKGVIDNWIGQSEQFSKIFKQAHSLAFKGTPGSKERIKGSEDLIKAYDDGLIFLKTMKKDWYSRVKEHVEAAEKRTLGGGMFGYGDVYDFEKTLDTVIKKYTASHEKNKSAVGKVSVDLQKGMPGLYLEIQKLHQQIEKIYSAPEYNEEELEVLRYAHKLHKAKQSGEAGISEQLDPNKTLAIKQKLVEIKNQLTKLIPVAKKYKQKLEKLRSKSGSNKIEISKRATELKPPEELLGIAPKTPTTNKGKRKFRIPELDNVRDMQRQINDMSVAFEIPIPGGRLKEDGKYWDKTAKAVLAILDKFEKSDPKQFPERAQSIGLLKSRGISKEMIANVVLLNAQTRYLNELTNIFDNIWAIHSGAKTRAPTQISQRQVPPTTTEFSPDASQCNRFKYSPTPNDIIACFKALPPCRPGELAGSSPVKPYDYAIKSLGWDDNRIVRMIYNLFGNTARSADWNETKIYDRLRGSNWAGGIPQ